MDQEFLLDDPELVAGIAAEGGASPFFLGLIRHRELERPWTVHEAFPSLEMSQMEREEK